MSVLSTKVQLAFVGVATALLALPVLVFPYPPMTDLPHHEALVGLLRHFGDTSLFPPGLYVKNLGQPNQLFHLVAWPLSYVFGVTLACKIVAAGCVASVPLGAVRLARALGAPPLAALGVMPIAVGWLFTWGFVNNLMALGILLAVLPLADRAAAEPTPRALALATGSAIVLFFAHELVMFVFVGAVLLFTLLHARSLRGLVLGAVPAFVALGAAVLQIKLQEKLKTQTLRMIPNVWTSFGEKFREIPSALVGGIDPTMRRVVFALTIAFIVLITSAHVRALLRRGGPDAKLRARLGGMRFELLALSSLGLYFAAPFTFNGAMLVHERFLAPAFAIFLVAGSVAFAPRLPAALFGAALPIAALAMLLPFFADAGQNYRSLEQLFEQIPLQSSVAAVDLDRTQGGRPFTVASGLSRVLVRRGGRVLYSFAESTVAPVRLDPAYQWDEPSARIMLDNTKFRPKHDLTRFRYLLVHTSDPRRFPLVAAALAEEARPIDAAGEWSLFESKLPVMPILSPDVPLPEPRPETLARRLFFIEKAAREGMPAEPRQ